MNGFIFSTAQRNCAAIPLHNFAAQNILCSFFYLVKKFKTAQVGFVQFWKNGLKK